MEELGTAFSPILGQRVGGSIVCQLFFANPLWEERDSQDCYKLKQINYSPVLQGVSEEGGMVSVFSWWGGAPSFTVTFSKCILYNINTLFFLHTLV